MCGHCFHFLPSGTKRQTWCKHAAVMYSAPTLCYCDCILTILGKWCVYGCLIPGAFPSLLVLLGMLSWLSLFFYSSSSIQIVAIPIKTFCVRFSPWLPRALMAWTWRGGMALLLRYNISKQRGIKWPLVLMAPFFPNKRTSPPKNIILNGVLTPFIRRIFRLFCRPQIPQALTSIPYQMWFWAWTPTFFFVPGCVVGVETWRQSGVDTFVFC